MTQPRIFRATTLPLPDNLSEVLVREYDGEVTGAYFVAGKFYSACGEDSTIEIRQESIAAWCYVSDLQINWGIM